MTNTIQSKNIMIDGIDIYVVLQFDKHSGFQVYRSDQYAPKTYGSLIAAKRAFNRIK